jgi:NTP pyrophosphatase (non-canonical NTP hydrolase)
MKNSEREIMLIAQEECAEVSQAISKVFRFGFDGLYNGNTNKQRLEEEIGDLMCMLRMMAERNLIDWEAVDLASNIKKIKLQKWSTINDIN